MTNQNCLAAVKCPECGNKDRFLIFTTILADVTDDGADIAGGSDMHWDDASMTSLPRMRQGRHAIRVSHTINRERNHDMKVYDNYEISPCTRTEEPDKPGHFYFEVCEPH